VKTLLTSILFILAFNALYAQGFYNSGLWRTKKVELTGGLGASNFLGDLGGRDRIGSNFIWDLEWPKTRYVAHITYLYYLQEKIAIRPSFYFARVSGDDALTQERYRNHRNLNFTSNLYELSITGEYQFLKEKIGNIYGVKTSTGKKLGLKAGGFGFYAVAGVGVVFYNPKAKGPNGANVSLRKLGTEGQGLPGGPKKYKPVTVVIPIGLGLRKSIGKDMGLKLELTHRFTFSDYIDDVSTNYYDNSLIRASNGDVAAFVADPSFKNDGLNNTSHGLQRGDPTDKDNYMFFTVSFYKKIKTKMR
jgi:hypothetical protein